MNGNASQLIAQWPEQPREAAQLVIDAYGEPVESTLSLLVWFDVGPWKRMVASRTFHQHQFPAPPIDSVGSTIDYHVPTQKCSALAEFDGSVVVERTVGEVSARCHDEQANFLALNLMNDIVTGAKTVEDAALLRQGVPGLPAEEAYAVHGEAPLHATSRRGRRSGRAAAVRSGS